jgi:hypothetical protein
VSADTQTSAIDERLAARRARQAGQRQVDDPSVADVGSLTFGTDGSAALIRHPQPRLRQLVGVCAWAALLGVFGLAVGIRGFLAELLGDAPGWYEPSMIIVGMVGIGLTVGAFVTVHRHRMPYVLLTVATAALGYAVVLTLTAL